MKYEKETNFQNAVFDQNMYCARMYMYVGHPISSDNGLISQKLL